MSGQTGRNMNRTAMIKPIYILFNMLILLNAHSFQTNAASSENSTTLNNSDQLNLDMIPNSVIDFANRMKQNGVDDIELMDLLFCACVVLLGLEFISIVVLKLSECKLNDNKISSLTCC